MINTEEKSEEKLVDGFSQCYSVAFFPGFDSEKFPLLLTREKDNVCILNMKTKKIHMIAHSIPTSNISETYNLSQ